MDVEQISKLLEHEEAEWLEFKHNNFDPDRIGRNISALSNSACLHSKENAYLVFGIDDNTKEPLGTDFDPYEAKKGNAPLITWLSNNLIPHVDFQIESIDYNGKKLVCFIIPAARTSPIRFIGKEYIRTGSSTQSLKDFPDKERKIWEKTSANSFESGIARVSLTAEEVAGLLDTETYFKLTGQTIPLRIDAIIEKLIQEQIVVKKGSKFSITNLGAILFAKNINDFPSLVRKAARVILYKGKDRTQTLKEEVGQKGYASGFEGLNKFIDLLSLNTGEDISSPIRENLHTFPPNSNSRVTSKCFGAPRFLYNRDGAFNRNFY